MSAAALRAACSGPRLVAAAALSALLAACASTSRVDTRMILPPGAAVMDIPDDRVFLMASPVTEPLPVFPDGVARSVEAIVCIEFIIDEFGAVRDAAPLYALPECPLAEGDLDPRFVSAALAAVSQWEFLAAAVCRFPQGAKRTDDCTGEGVEITPVAITVSHSFSFQRGRVRVTLRD